MIILKGKKMPSCFNHLQSVTCPKRIDFGEEEKQKMAKQRKRKKKSECNTKRRKDKEE
jgi:hypothetical protein